MVQIFFYSFLISIFTIPFAHFFLNIQKRNNYFFSKEMIFGIILVSFFALLINFFFHLNLYIASLLPLISLIIILRARNKFFNFNFLKFLLLNSLIITLLISESNVYRPDAGLYHLPYIGIINSEKIIFGITNLHFRYGHTSILQYFSAINNNFLFENNGIVFAQALIASSVILNFLSQINIYIKNRIFNFHFFYLFFIIIFIFYKMNRYSEYGNDAPAHFLVFFLISELILQINKFDLKNYGNNLILSLFIIQNKLTLIFIVLVNLVCLDKIKFKSLITDKKFLFVNFFFIIWLFKNLITSGCLLYPIKFTCNDKLSWTNIEEVEEISKTSEAWTKGWSNKSDNHVISLSDFNKNFNWIKPWLEVHFKIIIKILIPYITFCIFIIFLIRLKNLKNNEITLKKELIYYFVILLICFFVWFLKSPLFRYGYSFIVSILAFIFSYLAFKVNLTNTKKVYYFNIILFLFISIFISKNMLRIYKTDNNYNNYPWPKFYSMNKENKLSAFERIDFKEIQIVKPINGYCMYIKKICSHYNVPNDLKISNQYGYYFISKKN